MRNSKIQATQENDQSGLLITETSKEDQVDLELPATTTDDIRVQNDEYEEQEEYFVQVKTSGTGSIGEQHGTLVKSILKNNNQDTSINRHSYSNFQVQMSLRANSANQAANTGELLV